MFELRFKGLKLQILSLYHHWFFNILQVRCMTHTIVESPNSQMFDQFFVGVFFFAVFVFLNSKNVGFKIK